LVACSSQGDRRGCRESTCERKWLPNYDGAFTHIGYYHRCGATKGEPIIAVNLEFKPIQELEQKQLNAICELTSAIDNARRLAIDGETIKAHVERVLTR